MGGYTPCSVLIDYVVVVQDRVPFAVVGSNKVMDVNGKKVRGRQYPWGIVEVDNLAHNDFLALRDMLIRYYTGMFVL